MLEWNSAGKKWTARSKIIISRLTQFSHEMKPVKVIFVAAKCN